MTNKYSWFAGTSAKGWFGGVKALVMTKVDAETGALGVVEAVPLPTALKHVFDELDSLRKQRMGMVREIHDLIESKNRVEESAKELARENLRLRQQADFLRQPATAQHAVMASALAGAQLSAAEMLRTLHEASAKVSCPGPPDLFPTEFRDILDSVARRHKGGYLTTHMLKPMLFGEQASERTIPCPPGDMFPLRAGPGVTVNLQVTANDTGALATKVAEMAATKLHTALDK